MNNYSIFDAHCDTLCYLADNGGSICENNYKVDKKRMSMYRSYTQIFACFIAPQYHNDPKARFKRLYECYLRQNFSGINPILSLEGGEIIESLEDVDYLAQCGVKCIALTWNGTNKIAGGVSDNISGLTPFGKDVIRRMEKHGILVDVSHLNDKSFYDVADFAAGPIIATHSNSRAVCNHPRNLTDDMFKIVRDSGGVAGMNFYPLFLTESEECDSNNVIEHIEHFMSLDGVDAIGIGADFDGTSSLPSDLDGCGDVYRLFDKLNDMGMPKEYIEKITHANFMRLFGEE